MARLSRCEECGGPLEGWAGEHHSQQCSEAAVSITPPSAVLDKVVEARRHVVEAIRLLRDARVIVAERTNESVSSGAGDIDAALYALVGDDPEVENVLGPLDALLAANGRASEVWS